MVLTGRRACARRALHVSKKFMAPPRALGILSHHFGKKRRDLIQTCVLGVPDVLPVVMAGLQRVILNRDEIESDIIKTCFPCCHVVAFRYRGVMGAATP